METKLRSIVKSIVWRLIGVVILGGISYLVTRNWETTTTITLIFHFIRLITYYYHERLWNKILWGRIDDYQTQVRKVCASVEAGS